MSIPFWLAREKNFYLKKNLFFQMFVKGNLMYQIEKFDNYNNIERVKEINTLQWQQKVL